MATWDLHFVQISCVPVYLQQFFFTNNDRMNRRMLLMILTMVPVLICNKGKAALIVDRYTIMVIRYMIQEAQLMKVIVRLRPQHIFYGRSGKQSHTPAVRQAGSGGDRVYPFHKRKLKRKKAIHA
jgi:hypothetical protein